MTNKRNATKTTNKNGKGKKEMKKVNKGFKVETVKKAVSLMQEGIANYMKKDVKSIPMCISTGNKKIGHVLNVSLAPIITCGNCSECCRFCYDIKAVMAYPSARDARCRNTAIFLKSRDEFFNRLHEKMSRRQKNFYLRFHVSGEIVDLDHFIRMVETARKFPNYVIWTYTKMYGIVNEYCRKYGKESIPSNFTVMFSEWEGVPMDNPFGFPVFRCEFDHNKPIKEWHCPGNCDICKAMGRGCIVGESSTAYDH